MHWFLTFVFGIKLYMFRTVPLSIIRSFSLSTQQDQDGTSWSCTQAVSKPVWHMPLLCGQWKTPCDGQRNCQKHVEFYSKNKFEKLLHLIGFIIRIYHDSRSPERQIRMLMLLEILIVYFQYINPNIYIYILYIYTEEFKISLPSDFMIQHFFLYHFYA